MNESTKTTKIMIAMLVLVGVITVGLAIMSMIGGNNADNSIGNDVSATSSQPF